MRRSLPLFPCLLLVLMLALCASSTFAASGAKASRSQPAPKQLVAEAAPAPLPPTPEAVNPRMTPVVRVAKQAGPAVVSIVSAREVQTTPFTGSNPFQRFFEELNRNQPQPQKKPTGHSLGSGVIVDGKNAYVLTNAHVIAGASEINVRLQDGRQFTATLIGSDQDVDLAVLRLDTTNGTAPLPQARMGDSSDIMTGETVVAIGNPYGFNHTVTTGVVSAVDRSVSNGQVAITGLIQTDAAINPGNSGGPLLNLLGEVIGINAAVHAKGEGIGFAIPINKARRVLEEIIATGRVAHVWLGVLGENMSQSVAAYCGLLKPCGMVVTDVFPGTPAELAGIKPGDALLAIGGTQVDDKAQFLGILLGYTKGDTLTVHLQRGRDPFTVQMHPQVLDHDAGLGLLNWRWGFTPGKESAGGVLVDNVRENAPAFRLGLKQGDVLMQIGNTRIRHDDDLVSAFFRYQMHNVLILSIMRGAKVYNVRMKI